MQDDLHIKLAAIERTAHVQKLCKPWSQKGATKAPKIVQPVKSCRKTGWILMRPNLDTPGTYRIRVRGYLDSSWSDRLGGLTITQTGQGDESVETPLYGQVLDQAALAGVLSALYDLPLPLLSVEYLGDE